MVTDSVSLTWHSPSILAGEDVKVSLMKGKFAKYCPYPKLYTENNNSNTSILIYYNQAEEQSIGANGNAVFDTYPVDKFTVENPSSANDLSAGDVVVHCIVEKKETEKLAGKINRILGM